MDLPMRPVTSGKTEDNAREPLEDLLAAVLEALDIPSPATIGDGETHARVLANRTMHTVVALRAVLLEEHPLGIEWNTTYLRERLAEHPPTGYRAWGQPKPEAGPSCGRCLTPFDPTDTRFDGNAQYSDKPWCRRCVDNCHESSDASHVCPVCRPQKKPEAGR